MPDPYLVGLAMLSRRELSTTQVRDRLRRKGFAEHEIKPALRHLGRTGALDDQRTALALAHSSAHIKMHGRQRAIRELELKGISRELSLTAVGKVYDGLDEQMLLERALARRLGGPIDSSAELGRLYRYLIRQGFDGTAALSVLKNHTIPAVTEDPE